VPVKDAAVTLKEVNAVTDSFIKDIFGFAASSGGKSISSHNSSKALANFFKRRNN